jgi:hypothetical protein
MKAASAPQMISVVAGISTEAGQKFQKKLMRNLGLATLR